MSVTVEIAPELEARLREEAARQGVDATTFVVRALEERLRNGRPSARLSKAEADLLKEINLGIAPELWQQYHALIAKREAEILDPEEQAALIALSGQIEQANARRMGYLVELAHLRGLPLESLMWELGIGPSRHG